MNDDLPIALIWAAALIAGAYLIAHDQYIWGAVLLFSALIWL